MEAGQVLELFNSDSMDQYVDPMKFPSHEMPMYEIGSGMFRVLTGSDSFAGYAMNEFKSYEDFYEIIVPEDRDKVLNYTSYVVTWLRENTKVSILETRNETIYRVRGKGGKLYHVHRKGIVNGVAEGTICRNFTYFNDISWMHPGKCWTWRLSGPGSEFFDYEIPEISKVQGALGPREVEVLRLLARGFNSSDIANGLHISVHTVNTHRRNMLLKLEAANTPEMLTLARDMNLF